MEPTGETGATPKPEPVPEPAPEPEPTLLEQWAPIKNSDKPLSQLTFERGSFMASSVISGGIGAGLLSGAFTMVTIMKTEAMNRHEKALHHTENVGLALLAVPFIGVCLLHAWLRKGVTKELERRKNKLPSPPELKP